MKKNAAASTMGRPREFDTDAALDCALRVFWEKGYEGASLTDLTGAMGINRPSLYAAFGNKESLFRKAMERYAEGPAAYVKAALEQRTARAVAERLLKGSMDFLGNSKNPRGCLMIQSALACGDEASGVREELSKARCRTLEAIRKRFERAKAEGDLPRNTDACQLARFISTVMQGMAVQASSGACGGDLKSVVEMAMRAWPS
jgi:AcrR family transcriptional regulator